MIRFLMTHCLIGVAAGWLIVIGLLVTNLGGLRDLLVETESPGTALVLMLGAFAVTFGSVAMGVAIMMRPDGD